MFFGAGSSFLKRNHTKPRTKTIMKIKIAIPIRTKKIIDPIMIRGDNRIRMIPTIGIIRIRVINPRMNLMKFFIIFLECVCLFFLLGLRSAYFGAIFFLGLLVLLGRFLLH